MDCFVKDFNSHFLFLYAQTLSKPVGYYRQWVTRWKMKVLGFLEAEKRFCWDPTHQRPILALVHPWFTSDEHNRRKEKKRKEKKISFWYTEPFNIYIIYIWVVLKEYTNMSQLLEICSYCSMNKQYEPVRR